MLSKIYFALDVAPEPVPIYSRTSMLAVVGIAAAVLVVAVVAVILIVRSVRKKKSAATKQD